MHRRPLTCQPTDRFSHRPCARWVATRSAATENDGASSADDVPRTRRVRLVHRSSLSDAPQGSRRCPQHAHLPPLRRNDAPSTVNLSRAVTSRALGAAPSDLLIVVPHVKTRSRREPRQARSIFWTHGCRALSTQVACALSNAALKCSVVLWLASRRSGLQLHSSRSGSRLTV